ncbi:hypothetical protein ACIQCM_04500 [Pseudarthrobacter sp. NPDC092439]|uniref:hypothetical protein n=1 Tax=unclassified Pseudarthrobacter TaxID=2647000 RepID=UPI0037F90863
MTLLRFLAPAAAAVMVLASAAPGAAAAPEQFGPFEESYSFTVDCGPFDVAISGTASTRYTRFTDSEGNVTRVQQFVSAPADTWVNLTSQESIVVRGNFLQTWDASNGQLAIVGFRYLVNEPGDGVTVQEVGRIIYADRTELEVISMTGQHEVYSEELIGPAFCGELE